MLPDVGVTEYLVIAIVALIVVGPKDLPVLLKKLGQFVAKLRGLASEFRASFDEMARQSELDELRKEVEAMRRGQFTDVGSDMSSALDDIHQSLTDVGVQMHPPMSHQWDSPPVAETDPGLATAAEPAKKPRARKPAAPKTGTAQTATAKTTTAKTTAAKTAAAEPAAARKPRATKTAKGAAS